jgi:hypothetical protein
MNDEYYYDEISSDIEFSNNMIHGFKYCYKRSGEFFIHGCLLFSMTSIAFLISSYLVTNYVWKRRILTSSMKSEDEIEDVPYEDKYGLEEDVSGNVSDVEELEKKREISNCYVAENTPKGYVLMKYDVDYESFTYWSSSETIPYKYLETVARKYVKTIDDKELYISRERDIEERKKKLEESKAAEKTEDNKDPSATEDDVFVKLKSPVEKRIKTNKKIDYAIHGNKYKWMGKIDFNEIFKEKESETETSNMSFSAFKTMFGR